MWYDKENLCKGDAHYEICKKALSVLLSVLMLLSFAAVAFAEDGGATITVELEKPEVSFILNNIDLNSYPTALQAMITQKLIDDCSLTFDYIVVYRENGMQLLKSEHPDEWTQAQTLATAKMEKMYAASWLINIETDDYRWIKAMSGNENLLKTIGNGQEAIAESLTTYGANWVKLKAATDDLADGDYSLDKASARSAAGRTNSSGSAFCTTFSISSFLSLNNNCMYLPGRANTARRFFEQLEKAAHCSKGVLLSL